MPLKIEALQSFDGKNLGNRNCEQQVKFEY